MNERYTEPTEVAALFEYPLEAELAAGRLESEGIEAYVEHQGVLGISWVNPGRFGGVAVLVRTSDLEKAKQVLAEVEESYEPEIPPEYQVAALELPCPRCGDTSKKFHRIRPLQESIWVRSNQMHLKGPRWECMNCGHYWSANDA
jgi:predicted RNA-binding Zn-ribbon protein involved in translation (DUF1610 family)